MYVPKGSEVRHSQLKSRHWIIKDGKGKVEEVKGVKNNFYFYFFIFLFFFFFFSFSFLFFSFFFCLKRKVLLDCILWWKLENILSMKVVAQWTLQRVLWKVFFTWFIWITKKSLPLLFQSIFLMQLFTSLLLKISNDYFFILTKF